MKSALFACVFAVLSVGAVALQDKSSSCESEDLAVRAQLQNKLADVCVDMCKELGQYPEKCTCPDYTDTTDKTPNRLTWDELYDYMDHLKEWGYEHTKKWEKMSGLIQQRKVVTVSQACLSQDLK